MTILKITEIIHVVSQESPDCDWDYKNWVLGNSLTLEIRKRTLRRRQPGVLYPRNYVKNMHERG